MQHMIRRGRSEGKDCRRNVKSCNYFPFHLELGGVSAELQWADAPHTPDSTLIYVPEDRVLFIGDASLGSFENGGETDPVKRKHLIQTINSIDCDILLIGHQGLVKKKDFMRYY